MTACGPAKPESTSVTVAGRKHGLHTLMAASGAGTMELIDNFTNGSNSMNVIVYRTLCAHSFCQMHQNLLANLMIFAVFCVHFLLLTTMTAEKLKLKGKKDRKLMPLSC